MATMGSIPQAKDLCKLLELYFLQIKENVEYRDGIRSKGDKIGMPCTHTVQ